MSPAILYVGVGALLGPIGFAVVAPEFAQHGRLIEAVSETVLLLALFGAGLRLRLAIDWPSWRAPTRFAAVSLLATVLFVAGSAHLWFDLGMPAALLVGAILAPTDPLLTADMRLPTAEDGGVRTLLTAESALATLFAVPVLLAALGLLGVHNLGTKGVSWFTLDFVWSLFGGLAIGWFSGVITWRGFTRARSQRDTELPEEIVAVATIAVACGIAMIASASPLSAAFAAGLALSHGGRRIAGAGAERPSLKFQDVSARFERIGAAAALLLLGTLVHMNDIRSASVIFGLLVLALVRPIAARLGLGLSALGASEQRMAAWFGMRGVVSIYLLSLAVNHGLAPRLARELAGIVLVVLVTCVVLQGLSSTPFIRRRVSQRA